HQVTEVPPDVLLDLLREPGPAVVHRQEDPQDPQVAVQRAPDPLDRLLHTGDSREGVVLGLERHDQQVGGPERVDREGAHRGRGVDDDVVVVGAHTNERPGQQGKVLTAGVELDGGPREVPGGRQQVEVLRGRLHRRLTSGGTARDHVVDSVLWVCNADAAAGFGLRVEVDEQLAAPLGECCSQVDGRRRLPYAALLVDHPDYG